MFLTNLLGIAMFNLIRATMELSENVSGASVSLHELSNKPALGLRFCRTTGKDLVAFFVGAFARTLRVNVFTVIAPVMMGEFFCYQTTC
jgi:hypothetical protein